MFRGALVPNLTFFTRDGALDLDATRAHMRWLLERGADGLFVTGTYGSGPLMTLDERAQVLRAAKEVVGEFPGRTLMAHVGCIDTHSTVALGRIADEVGVDAMSAIPSYYYKHSEEGVVEFYRALKQAVQAPVFAYNNPETSRFTFTLSTVRRVQELGLAGLKDSPLDVGFVSSVYYEAKTAGRAFEVIVGSSKGWLPFHAMGIQAMISGMSNWAPELIAALVQATFANDAPRAEALYVAMMELSREIQAGDSVIAAHMALAARGYPPGFPRAPLLAPPASDARVRTFAEALRKAYDTVGLALEA
ncbi:MAG: dihydrodipicolinate synthase family protein [Caldilineaceae bacterium]